MEIKKIKKASLFLTHQCNLACTYCYAGHHNTNKMDLERALKALNFIAEHSEAFTVVSFFGGEPLLEWDLIKEIIKSPKKPKKILLRMTTNGSLLDQEKIDFLHQNNILYAISLDGCQDMHDRQRPYKSGKSSYQDIAANSKMALDRNPYIPVINILSPQTASLAAEAVENLYQIGFRYIVQTLDFSAKWQDGHIKNLKKQYQKLASFYYSRLKKDEALYLNIFDDRIMTHAHKPYCKGDLCDMANSEIAIAPSGNIYPCVQFVGNDDASRKNYCVGDIFDGFDKEKREALVRQNYQEIESCKGCALYGRCATFCGCLNWASTGSVNTIPPVLCEWERILMPIADKVANKLWKNKPQYFKQKYYGRFCPVSSGFE